MRDEGREGRREVGREGRDAPRTGWAGGNMCALRMRSC